MLFSAISVLSATKSNLRGALAALIMLLFAAAPPARAQDGKAVLQAMIAKYHSFDTYQGEATAIMRQALPDGRVVAEHGFTSLLRFKKPNMLKLEFTMPEGGRSVYCTGQQFIYYQHPTQTYNMASVTITNMRQMSALLAKLKIVSKYDTLYFLFGGNLPGNVTNITRKPDELRNGRPVYVVTAHEKEGAGVYNLRWLIDKQTSLLTAVEGRSSGAPDAVSASPTGAGPKIHVDRIFTQTIVNPRPNVPISSAEFTFRAPEGVRKFPFRQDLINQFRSVSASPTGATR